jgi:5-methylcytosine-specific restriction endonuclease McrA
VTGNEYSAEEITHNVKAWARDYLKALERVEQCKAQYKAWADLAATRLTPEDAYQTAYSVFWDNPAFPPGLTGLICGKDASKVATYLVKREYSKCVQCDAPIILETKKNHSNVETMCESCGRARRKAEYAARYAVTPEQEAIRLAANLRLQQERQAQEAELQALRDMPYIEYLKTDHWAGVRKDAMKRAGFRCQLCNANGVTLDTHHRTYENLGREQRGDVIVLCRPCHAKHHGKEE